MERSSMYTSELSKALSAITEDPPLGSLDAQIKRFPDLKAKSYIPRSLLQHWLDLFFDTLSEVIVQNPSFSGDKNSVVSLLKATCYEDAPDHCNSVHDLKRWPYLEGVELVEGCKMSRDFSEFLEHRCFNRSGRERRVPKSAPDVKVFDANVTGIATVESWDREFLGSLSEVLHETLRKYMSEDSLYARVVPHVQSSGTGKSRAHDELAKTILYIPLNLAGPEATTYPPRDPRVEQWFAPSNNLEQRVTQNRCHAFLHALLTTTLSRLREICANEAVAQEIHTKIEPPLAILAYEFRDRMAKGRMFEAHGDYRRKFYDDVVTHAQENLNTISRSTQPFSPSNTKLPVSAASSEGRDPAGQPKPPGANEGNKMAIKTTPLFNDNLLTIVQVGQEIIHLLNPQELDNISPHVVICWDESHSLIKPAGNGAWTIFLELQRALYTIRKLSFISIFLSTVGKFHHFSPIPHDPSACLMVPGIKMLPPITEVCFDQFAEKADCMVKLELEKIASTHQIVHLGRALFPTRFDNGGSSIKEFIVHFAADKLLCRPSGNIKELESDESLACLAVRLGLDFKATSWSDSMTERNQVERHMRICLAATVGFETMLTISPSEPLLAEASWLVMKRNLGPTEAPKALLRHINESYLNAGVRSEVVAALLLLLARDKAIEDRYVAEGKDYKSDGEARTINVLQFVDALVPTKYRPFVRGRRPISCSSGHSPSTTLASAFANAYIYFNHFIKVHDFKMVNREYLWRLICRGAAVICADNQHGIDIIIPVLMGKLLHPQFVTAVFVQVKNDRSFHQNVFTSLFKMMDPFKAGLFSEADAKAPALPPILRIVLALASEKPNVTAPRVGERKSPHPKVMSKFTAYDLWIAGVSSQSFGVIPDDNTTHNQYRLLVDRTRCVFGGYSVPTARHDACENNKRIEVRRMMHAAATSQDQHYQNYIRNFTIVPQAHEHSAKNDVEGFAKPMESDESESEYVDTTSEEGTMDVDYS